MGRISHNLPPPTAKWCGICAVFEFAGLRYGAVFGPWSGAGGGGPSNVIREAMKNALAGREAVVPPGAMEWVYSKDAARSTVLALDAKDLGSGIFNITMGRLTTPAEMAEGDRRRLDPALLGIGRIRWRQHKDAGERQRASRQRPHHIASMSRSALLTGNAR